MEAEVAVLKQRLALILLFVIVPLFFMGAHTPAVNTVLVVYGSIASLLVFSIFFDKDD